MDGNYGKKLATALLLITFSVSASAESVQVVGSVDVNFKNLTFNPGGTTTTTPLTTINPNLIFAYKRWYGSISYDGALADGTISMMDNSFAQTLSISRSDLILTGGYRLSSNFSVFGGLLGGNIKALQSGPRKNGTVLYWTVSDISYGETGPFVGGAYTIPVGKKSSLNFSVAYANMQGSLSMDTKSTETGGTGGSGIGTLTTSNSSETFGVSGLSYGVTLTGEMNQTMSYRTGIKATSYEGNSSSSTIKEAYTSFFFGVTNYF